MNKNNYKQKVESKPYPVEVKKLTPNIISRIYYFMSVSDGIRCPEELKSELTRRYGCVGEEKNLGGNCVAEKPSADENSWKA